MIRTDHMYDFIKRTLSKYGLVSQQAVDLMLGTYLQEGIVNGQTCLRQLTGKYDLYRHALGIFQMEWNTFAWILEVYVSKLYSYGIVETPNIELLDVDTLFRRMEYDLDFALLMARLRYLVVPKAIHPPEAYSTFEDYVDQLAHYWKKYYNTSAGAGVPEEFSRKLIKILR